MTFHDNPLDRACSPSYCSPGAARSCWVSLWERCPLWPCALLAKTALMVGGQLRVGRQLLGQLQLPDAITVKDQSPKQPELCNLWLKIRRLPRALFTS
eukprot:CAMPEP_0172921860 /NCGR_PEP_ID=MMETSP1075-20121228/206772_1 /TAXON_ID=2916 /ORGANISM="Ceratium fusus, Strain PA161109" /LENGTH=97 /DNA_ID=CAMNT_0013782099 /DNA_START=249 /DNA_END=542 /DNA_ORIENTATION=+